MPRLSWGARWSWRVVAPAASAASLLLAPMVVQAQSSPSKPSTHVVQPGDTLLQIALDAGVDTDALASLNGLNDPNALSVGATLKLPAGASSPSAPASVSSSSSPASASASSVSAAAAATRASAAVASSGGTYTVADGDNLWDIATHFGTSSDALQQLNQLDDPAKLSLGMVLKLPAGAAPVSQAATPRPAASTPTASASGNGSATQTTSASSGRMLTVSYTVQSGETLSQIAKQFDVHADAIVQASGLDDANKIGTGSVVKVPVPAKEHVVADGETLRDIAGSEKVDLGSLIDFNHLTDPELIRVGQVLVLPVAATRQGATSSVARVATTPTAATTATAPSATPTPSPAQDADASDGNQAASVPQAPVATTATPNPPAQPTPNATPSATPSAAKTVSPNASVTPKPAATPAPKPAAPVAVVSAPPGAPADGLAGASLKLLGDAYVWGGSTPSGFDCSGFIWYVAKQVGKPVSRGMEGQYNSGSHPDRNSLQVGDLVFFQNTYHPGLSHNGVYIGGNQFVHAADERAGVTISNLTTPYWTSHWFGATRLP